MAAPRQDNLKTVDEVFLDSILPTPPGPTPLWGPGSIPDNWGRNVSGFLINRLALSDFEKVNEHGAFSIPRAWRFTNPTHQG